jgi:hypothetical protein
MGIAQAIFYFRNWREADLRTGGVLASERLNPSKSREKLQPLEQRVSGESPHVLQCRVPVCYHTF